MFPVVGEVVIRTNSVDTALTVNGPSDDVKHYGIVGNLNITAVRSDHCYHEHGFVKELLSFGTGKFVVESTALFHQTKEQVAALFEGETKSYVEGKDPQYNQHVYDAEGVCLVDGCNETTATHVHSWGEYAHDETNHWQICASCSAESTHEAHTITYNNNTGDTHDENCSVCGYNRSNVSHNFVNGTCACGAKEQELIVINITDTYTMSIGELVNIRFNSSSSLFWSFTSPTSIGADNEYHDTITNDYISISNIDVENNTATVTALKAGTNTVHVVTKYEESSSASVIFSIVVSGTANTATIDPTKYDSILGTPDHLVFGEYSKYESVVTGAPSCVMDQAGKGTIRAYMVEIENKETETEKVLYILSQSSMMFPQPNISSITARFKNVKTIDLGNLDFSAATSANDFKNMFYDGRYGLTNLTTIYVTAEQVEQMHKYNLTNVKMFQECVSLVGGIDTTFDEHMGVYGSYYGTKGYYCAYIDGQGIEENAYIGYFTDRINSPYYVAN